MSNTSPNTQPTEADQASDAMLAEQALTAQQDAKPEQIEQIDNSADVIAMNTREKVEQISPISPLEQCAAFADRIKNEPDTEKRKAIMQEAAEAGLVKLRKSGSWGPVATIRNLDLKEAQKAIANALDTVVAPEAQKVAEPKVDAKKSEAPAASKAPAAPEATETNPYIDRFKTANTKAEFMEITNEMFDAATNTDELEKIMNECKVAKIVKRNGEDFAPSNRWGSAEYKKMVMDTLINEYYTRLKAIGKPKVEGGEKKSPSKPESTPSEPKQILVKPLVLEVDGKTFNTRRAFEKFYNSQERKLKTNAELTDEQREEKMAELKILRKKYGEALRDIQGRISRAALKDIDALAKTTRVDEILDYYAKDNLLLEKGASYTVNKQAASIVTLQQLIDAASERKQYIAEYFRIKNKFNGFEKFMKTDDGRGKKRIIGRFVFQVNEIKDDLTGETLIKIYNVRSLWEGGKTDYKEGQEINLNFAGKDMFIQMIPEKMKARKELRDKQARERAKAAEARKADAAKKATAAKADKANEAAA